MENEFICEANSMEFDLERFYDNFNNDYAEVRKQDDIVGIKTSKLAKKCGFDWPTLFFYFEDYNAGLDYILVDYIGDGQFGGISIPENHNAGNYAIKRYSAPLQSMLQSWIKYKYGVCVSADITSENTYFPMINGNKDPEFVKGCASYCEAMEFALQTVLMIEKYGEARKF